MTCDSVINPDVTLGWLEGHPKVPSSVMRRRRLLVSTEADARVLTGHGCAQSVGAHAQKARLPSPSPTNGILSCPGEIYKALALWRSSDTSITDVVGGAWSSMRPGR
jgi:hypothetical protein